jgi:hypothetical protein
MDHRRKVRSLLRGAATVVLAICIAPRVPAIE